ncbi:MAG: hypothetical protein V8T87_11080, partial [Victivallales bacterium]
CYKSAGLVYVLLPRCSMIPLQEKQKDLQLTRKDTDSMSAAPATAKNWKMPVIPRGQRTLCHAGCVCEVDSNDTPSPCDELAGFRATYLAHKAIEALELKRALPVPIEKITPCIN